MKSKILIISLLSTISIISFTNASELLLKPSHGSFAPGCTIGVDIALDPEDKQISATDIVIESSMEFIKFEPTQLFPYFLPPKVLKASNIVHIVGFTVQPSQRVKEKGIIGRIYLKPKNQSDKDGSIKFYFKKNGDTTDSNLSIAGGIDTIEDVRNGFYTFDGTNCEYPEVQTKILNNEQEIRNLEKQMQKEHNATIRQIKRDEMIQKIKIFWNDNKYYVIISTIIIIVLITYIKLRKGKSSKK